jgi:hypothetical protein
LLKITSEFHVGVAAPWGDGGRDERQQEGGEEWRRKGGKGDEEARTVKSDERAERVTEERRRISEGGEGTRRR